MAEQLTHANISTTARYADTLNIEKLRSINEMLVMKKVAKTLPENLQNDWHTLEK